MFKINEDLSIYVTRGDSVLFDVEASQGNEAYTFQQGDSVVFKVYGKRKATDVVIDKKFDVTSETTKVQVYLTEEETKIGNAISKPVDYWYEIALVNVGGTQTIIGYDDNGAKIFRLFPEGVNSSKE